VGEEIKTMRHRIQRKEGNKTSETREDKQRMPEKYKERIDSKEER